MGAAAAGRRLAALTTVAVALLGGCAGDAPSPHVLDGDAFDSVSGCGDAIVYASTEGRDIGVVIEWDGAASRAQDDGGFAGDVALPSDEVSVELWVGRDVTDGLCTDVVNSREVIDQEWVAVSGDVEITARRASGADPHAPHARATVTLREVVLQPREGSADEPSRIDAVDLPDVDIGWVPG